MNHETVLALGVIATNVSVFIHTWQLRRQREIIEWNREQHWKILEYIGTLGKESARQGQSIDTLGKAYMETRHIANRVVQRVDLLEERAQAPAKKEGRQWP